jgi:hypothetical protein
MTSLASYCRNCGRALDPGSSDLCAQCSISYSPATTESKPNIFDLVWAFLVWGVSGGFMLMADTAYRLAYWFAYHRSPEIQLTRGVVIISLGLMLMMHLAGFVAAWLAVTKIGRRPFWRTLGWGWHPQFKMVHAVGLAFLMIGVAVLLERTLPHRETDLEKILKMGMAVRVMVAVLAVVTAPLIEEIVYRGIVYSGIEGLMGKAAGVTAVTVLFALVHVPQYWGSVAAITAIVSLSLVLTLLRAWTGKLLPCVVMHLVYNGVQAVALLVAQDETSNESQMQAAFLGILQSLGLG